MEDKHIMKNTNKHILSTKHSIFANDFIMERMLLICAFTNTFLQLSRMGVYKKYWLYRIGMPMPQGYTKICKAMHTVKNNFYFILKIINEVHFQILYFCLWVKI